MFDVAASRWSSPNISGMYQPPLDAGVNDGKYMSSLVARKLWEYRTHIPEHCRINSKEKKLLFPSKPCEVSVVAALLVLGMSVPRELENSIIAMCAAGFPPRSIATNIYRLQAWPRRRKTIQEAFPEYSFQSEEFEELKELYFKMGDCARFADEIINLIEKNGSTTIAVKRLQALNTRLCGWDDLVRAFPPKFKSIPDIVIDDVQFRYFTGILTDADVLELIKIQLADTSNEALINSPDPVPVAGKT